MKKLEKFLQSPQNTRYSQIETILISLGWNMRERKGSHKIFTKPGEPRLVFSLHKKDCPDYQKQEAASKISSSLPHEQ